MDDLEKVIGLLLSGFVSGMIALYAELIIYMGSWITQATSASLANTALALTPDQMATLGSLILLMILIDIAQNFFVGLLAPLGFGIGFLVGDLFVLKLMWVPLAALGHGIIWGMIFAFVAVLGGMIVKIIFWK